MKSVFFFIILVAACSCSPAGKQDLHGKWRLKFKDGSDVLATFRADSTHDYFVNGKLFSSGKSILSGDTLKTMDPICNAEYFATYLVNYISPDSIRFVVVEDTCQPRKRDMDGVGLRRVK